MRDKYTEFFIVTEIAAQQVLRVLEADHESAGMYACAGGFVVWADTTTSTLEAA